MFRMHWHWVFITTNFTSLKVPNFFYTMQIRNKLLELLPAKTILKTYSFQPSLFKVTG